MGAPVLESLANPALPPEVEGAELFRVRQGGQFAGRLWVPGEVMMCRGEARSGDAVVLVSRGRQGRPRVGRMQGTRFLGEVGEPCHPARWRACGKVVAAWSPRGERWAIERVAAKAGRSDGALGEGPSRSALSPMKGSASSVFAADPNQLALFAA